MPNRILRDWTDSEAVNELSFQAEVMFTRLIMKVDDFGRFHAKPALVKAALFPHRLESLREADISRWMDEILKAGLIAIYDVDNKPYLEIINFGQRLRIKQSKFPHPSECPPNDRQTTVKRLTDDGAKGREVETKRNEVEDEKKASTPTFSKTLVLSIGKLFIELESSHTWHEAAAKILKVKPERIREVIPAFIDHLKGIGKEFKGIQDAKEHFVNWYRKNPEMKPKEQQFVAPYHKPIQFPDQL